MPTGVIRPATPKDAELIVTVHRGAVLAVDHPSYGPEILEAWASNVDDATVGAMATSIDNVSEHAFVAQFSGVTLGWFSLTDDGSHLRAFYVAADYHGRGVGKAMMAVAAAGAKSLENDMLTTHASLNSVEFYRSQGFIGEEPVEVPIRKDRSIGAIAMSLDLTGL